MLKSIPTKLKSEGIFLVAENPEFDNIPIRVDSDFSIWGVVTHIIREV